MKQNYELQNFGPSTQSQAFVDQSSTLTPITSGTPGVGQFLSSVIGRAPIPDITNDFRASLGIERIQTQQIQLLQSEQGANGEPVYSVLNDDRGLIRFVGGGWSSANGANGPTNLSNIIGNYVEITFYGTGLNLLGLPHTTTHVIQLYVDGVLTSSNIYSAVAYSSIIHSRNYAAYTVVPVVSGLTLGIHTIKLVQNDGVANLYVPGFEILNTNASGLVNINPGTAYYRGQRIKNNAFDSIAYNTGVTGTKGGRIVRYFTADDTPGQVFTAVNGSVAYGNSADHTNEEVARTYYPREFGAGRYNATYANEDDFSLMGGVALGARSAAFTLDDGTATLVATALLASWVTGNPEGIVVGNAGSHTLTFVGCGLDILYYDSSVGTYTAGDHTYSIDGATPANWSTIAGVTGTTTLRIQKIVSGLAYGTHTFTFSRTAAALSPVMVAFKVYQPKKPTLPTGAVEICDYNVIANYVANSTAGLSTIGSGLLRKYATREFNYVGTWSITLLTDTYVGGWEVWTTISGNYAEYTFFGTGFDFRGRANTGWSATNTVSLQNLSSGGSLLTLNNTNFPGLTTGQYGGYTFTYSSGNLAVTGSNTLGSGFYVSGLPLGLYKIRFSNGTSNAFVVESFDVITPIHVHKSVGPAVLQNTLAVGSQGLTDSRQTQAVATTTKAWAQAVGVAASVTYSGAFAPFTPVPDLSVTVKTSGGPLELKAQVYASCVLANCQWCLSFYVDGVLQTGAVASNQTVTAGTPSPITTVATVAVAAGFHKVDAVWRLATGGSSSVNAQTDTTNNYYNRILTVREL